MRFLQGQRFTIMDGSYADQQVNSTTRSSYDDTMLCMYVGLWINKRVKEIYNNKSSSNVSMNDPQNGKSMDGIALYGGVCISVAVWNNK